MNFIHRTQLIITLSVFAVVTNPLFAKNVLPKANLSKINKAITTNVKEVKGTAAKAQGAITKKEEGIPLTGDLSDADEQALGREIAGRFLAANPLITNDSLQHYVNLVGAYVAQQSKRPTLSWTFGVIESDDINAFALPGGYVLVTKGLYATLRNEAELAGVLGHEIGHVALRHHVRLLQKERLIAKGADFLAGASRQDAIKTLAGNGATLWTCALDRNAEFGCDRLGCEHAARAGYDPYAYLEVLDRMGVNTSTDRLTLLYKTHPHPKDRITALEEAMSKSWLSVSGIVPTRWVNLP